MVIPRAFSSASTSRGTERLAQRARHDLILFGGDGAQVDDHPAPLGASDHGRVGGTEPRQDRLVTCLARVDLDEHAREPLARETAAAGHAHAAADGRGGAEFAGRCARSATASSGGSVVKPTTW